MVRPDVVLDPLLAVVCVATLALLGVVAADVTLAAALGLGGLAGYGAARAASRA